jgi:hypothetical protein
MWWLTVTFISEAVTWMYEVFCTLILMSALTEMVQSQTIWPATGCSNVTWKLWCQITRLSIHEWIGIFGLGTPNEVNIHQHEWPKNGRLKQYWLQHTLLCIWLPTQWEPIPEGETHLVMTHFLATRIWILCIFLDVSLVCYHMPWHCHTTWFFFSGILLAVLKSDYVKTESPGQIIIVSKVKSHFI